MSPKGTEAASVLQGGTLRFAGWPLVAPGGGSLRLSRGGHEVVSTAESGMSRQRMDKARNRLHILEVAEDFFAQRGVGGSLETIAKRAGVGPGTFYRHFPSREALIAALLQARYEELFDRLEVIKAESSDSGLALEQWLDALGEYVTAFDGLPEPLRLALSEESSPLAITCQNFITATDELLAAAQRD